MSLFKPRHPRIGLIARADDRGLGHLTWEFSRAMKPDATLVVDLGDISPFPNHLERFDDPLVMSWSPESKRFAALGGEFTDPDAEVQVRRWLTGLDVLYSAETFYDWRIVQWARDAGVATVLHVMPELLPEQIPDRPDEIWNPTWWRHDQLPAGSKVVPVPVATDRFPDRREFSGHPTEPLRVLHVAGRRAAADRNGTNVLLRALSEVAEPMVVTIATQEQTLPALSRIAPNVIVEPLMASSAPANYWDLYDGHDVLVMPRRYGGLCLPVQEAAAAGLALVMTDTAPNSNYPTGLIPCRQNGTLLTPAGSIPLLEADPSELAQYLDRLAVSKRDIVPPGDLEQDRRLAWRWALSRSWDVQAPIYRRMLVEAVRGAQGGSGEG